MTTKHTAAPSPNALRMIAQHRTDDVVGTVCLVAVGATYDREAHYRVNAAQPAWIGSVEHLRGEFAWTATGLRQALRAYDEAIAHVAAVRRAA